MKLKVKGIECLLKKDIKDIVESKNKLQIEVYTENGGSIIIKNVSWRIDSNGGLYLQTPDLLKAEIK